MTTLFVENSGTTDFRGGAAETDIDRIEFQAPAAAIAIFDPAQFGPGLISNTVDVVGDANDNTVRMQFSSAATFSAAGWSFTDDWTSDDSVQIFGSDGGDNITGSSRNDDIAGTSGTSNGVDHIDAGAGNDKIQMNISDIDAGTTIEGGTQEAGGFDQITVNNASLSTDLRPAEISGVERLSLLANGLIVTVGGDQIGTGGFTQLSATSTSTVTLRVLGSDVDLSGVTTFENWGADDTISIEGTSTFANELVGSSQKDIISGTGNSVDHMTGGDGADTLTGGNGGDSFFYLSGGDVDAGETINGGGSTDELRLVNAGAIDFSLATIIDVEQVDFISGNTAATFTGDSFDSGEIASVLGSAGIDQLIVTTDDQLTDLVNVSFGQWTDGTDTITILGSGLQDILGGSAKNDIIDGGGAADFMHGEAGNDTYVVNISNDSVNETAGEGTDLVQSSVTYALSLSQEIENLTLTGAAAINGTGNGLANALTGNSAANVLSGGGQNDTLTGFGGSDRLDGGAEGDAMSGGNGDDTYVVDNAGDTASESSGSGVDLVQSTVTFTLASGIENLILTGTSAINGTGNAGVNAISGNSAANQLSGLAGNDTLTGFGGADRLDGGAGADTMAGGNGDDTYVVDNAGDTASEASGSGVDTVSSTVSFTLAAGVENLVLNGAAAINGTGNGGANTLSGNSAVNRLDGNAGNDTMTGFGGADVFVFDDGDGADTVTDFANGSDTFDVSAVAGVNDFADLTVIDNGATVTVDYGAGSFTLANIANPAVVDATDFAFA